VAMAKDEARPAAAQSAPSERAKATV